MKGLGALLLSLASLLAGALAAGSLKRRGRELEELAFALGLLDFELESFCRPLPELCRRLEHSAPGAGGAMFERLCRAMEEEPAACFEGHWSQALAPLAPPERRILASMGAVLGRYGAAEQRRALALCRERLEELAAEERDKYRRNARLYVGLGGALGLGISLMLL